MASVSSTANKCSLCSQVFQNKGDLNDHMSLHLGNKKHMCTICGKKFFNEKSLDLHVKIHNTELKYEALSTSSSEQLVLPDQDYHFIPKLETNQVPQMKVRVKSFQANALRKETPIEQHMDNGNMQFQFNEAEFGVIEESEVYTTHGEAFQDRQPVQLKVWSKEKNYKQTTYDSTDDSSKVPYVIKVMNKNVESHRGTDSDVLRLNESEDQQPIRIFVGNNISLENLGDLNTFTSTGEEFRTEGLPQVGMHHEQSYSYETYGESAYEEVSQGNQPLQEHVGEDDLRSLQEVIEEGDLQSLQQQLGEEELKSLEEGINEGSLHASQGDSNSMNMTTLQENVISRNAHVTEKVVLIGGTQVPLTTTGSVPTPLDFRNVNMIANQQEITHGNLQPLQQAETPQKELYNKSEASVMIKMHNNEQQPIQDGTDRREEPLFRETDSDGKQMLLDKVDELSAHKGNDDDSSSVEESSSLDIQDDNNAGVMAPFENRIVGNSSLYGDCVEKTNLRVGNIKPVPQLKDTGVAKNVVHPRLLKEQPQPSSKGQHKCLVCGLAFKFSFHLKTHMAIHTSNSQSYSCGVCGASFRTMESYDEHRLSHEGQHWCSRCVKEFPSEVQLKKHLEMHKDAKQHECCLCRERFQSYSLLRTHLRSHTVHKCYICDKVFKEASKLKRHIKSHLNKKLHHCSVCNRTLYCHPNDFHRHELLHESVTTCSRCSKEFSSRPLLLRHKMKCSMNSEDSSLQVASIDRESVNSTENVSLETDDQKKVRSRVAELLIDDLLRDMSREDMKSSPFQYEPREWLEKASEGLTKEKLRDSISGCNTKGDVLRELSVYFENDIIKDAVSDFLLRERIAVQKLSSMMGANEKIISSKSRKRKVRD